MAFAMRRRVLTISNKWADLVNRPIVDNRVHSPITVDFFFWGGGCFAARKRAIRPSWSPTTARWSARICTSCRRTKRGRRCSACRCWRRWRATPTPPPANRASRRPARTCTAASGPSSRASSRRRHPPTTLPCPTTPTTGNYLVTVTRRRNT